LTMPNIHPSAIIEDGARLVRSKVGRNCRIGAGTSFNYSELGDYSYVSSHSHIFSTMVGRFSCLSWNVSVNPARHDYRRMTQHSMLFAPSFGMVDSPLYRQYEDTFIGSDCWIGCNSLIMGGVKVCDGALVGAGARISHDVPPYAIMVGNNRHIRNRFPDEVIADLLDLKWWEYPAEKIRENISLLGETPTVETVAALKRALQETEETGRCRNR